MAVHGLTMEVGGGFGRWSLGCSLLLRGLLLVAPIVKGLRHRLREALS
jgi:hypothetical protein